MLSVEKAGLEAMAYAMESLDERSKERIEEARSKARPGRLEPTILASICKMLLR